MNIHLILNAHIDPVWLWPWQAGVDEAVATCRSACDRLDRHPDIVFSRGEAWVYDIIERVDPILFSRIKDHIAAGRWEVTGGWWIQPDCNAPSGWAWEKQIELGQRYFQDRFGLSPKVGYNVDSFGHAATLPELMRRAGQSYYVMMRPQEHEKKLPARLFRWRGYENGPEVLAFRIAGSYTSRDLTIDYIKKALEDIPEGIENTMCFIGLGDHGGGPTEAQIAWLREHWNDIPGATLLFSSPQRFFDAVCDRRDRIPVVTGELQMHAVGCYSVHRAVKTSLRRAEHLVRQAQTSVAGDIEPPLLEKCWKNIAFAQFHDILGGTCLPSAYRQIEDQLGFASSVADEALQLGLRRKIASLPDDRRQRIVAWNASDRPWRGYAEFEPWLESQKWEPQFGLVSEAGEPVPFQILSPEAQANEMPRLLFPVDLAPNQIVAIAIDRCAGANAPVSGAAGVSRGALRSEAGTTVNPRLMTLGPLALPLPELKLYDDSTDTWSHNIDRYAETPVAAAVWSKPSVVDSGPVMASLIREGTIGTSRVKAEWRVYAGRPAADLILQVHWQERFKVLKLALSLRAGKTRIDGISGGHLERANSGAEAPLRDWTLLGGGDRALGIVAPDVYALDAAPSRVRLTLLRSPYLAWHIPNPGVDPRGQAADQGVHVFRFRFIAGASAQELDDIAIALQRPLIMADVTRGMPER